jgi:pheromone a factor receptor
MIYGINAILWAGSVDNPAPLWCDISELQIHCHQSLGLTYLLATKLIIGANTALPLASMCVCKHLELVSSNRRVRFDHIDKRRRIIFDSAMCFGIPLLFMALRKLLRSIFVRKLM